MKKQDQKAPKKVFRVYLQIDNYQKILEYADQNDTTLAYALNEMIRAFPRS